MRRLLPNIAVVLKVGLKADFSFARRIITIEDNREIPCFFKVYFKNFDFFLVYKIS